MSFSRVNLSGVCALLALSACGASAESSASRSQGEPGGGANAGTGGSRSGGGGASSGSAGSQMGGSGDAAGFATAGAGGSAGGSAGAGGVSGASAVAPSCSTVSGYSGDDVCLTPPDPSQGFQLHYGPHDYADSAAVSPFTPRAGRRKHRLLLPQDAERPGRVLERVPREDAARARTT